MYFQGVGTENQAQREKATQHLGLFVFKAIRWGNWEGLFQREAGFESKALLEFFLKQQFIFKADFSNSLYFTKIHMQVYENQNL